MPPLFFIFQSPAINRQSRYLNAQALALSRSGRCAWGETGGGCLSNKPACSVIHRCAGRHGGAKADETANARGESRAVNQSSVRAYPRITGASGNSFLRASMLGKWLISSELIAVRPACEPSRKCPSRNAASIDRQICRQTSSPTWA